MLYIVSTPIGNLGDLSFRALEILKEVDYVLCEDTRTSRILLDHYDIKKPLQAFHKFNESRQESAILNDLKEGKKIALISDAGTPGLSDPGEKLIHAVIAHDLPLTPIPGATAFLSALQLSGFPLIPFQFVGFLPRKTEELRKTLESILTYPGTTVLYESPHRLLHLLELLPQTRNISVSREITKRFEETVRGSAQTVLAHFTLHPPKGEFVVAIAAGDDLPPPPLTLEEAAKKLLQEGLSKPSIIKTLSQQFKLTKREISQALLKTLQ
jgi:16S rRNA (cytidine1402-2'-O)-methyltransferase